MSYHNAYICTPLISSGHVCSGMRYLHFLLQETLIPRAMLGISANYVDRVRGKTMAIKLYKAIKESDFVTGSAKQRAGIISHPLSPTQIKFADGAKNTFITARATRASGTLEDGSEVETVVEMHYGMGYNIKFGGRFLRPSSTSNWGATQDPSMLAAPSIMYDDREIPAVIKVSGHRVIESQFGADIAINSFRRAITESMGSKFEENQATRGPTGKVYRIFTKVNRILHFNLVYSYKYYFTRRSPSAKVIW